MEVKKYKPVPLQKFFLVAVILFFTLPYCFSQTRKLDSLKKLLPSLSDSARLDCIHGICTEYTCLGNRTGNIVNASNDSAELYCNTLFEESRKINYIRGIAESFRARSLLRRLDVRDPAASEQMAKTSLHWYQLTTDKTGVEFSFFLTGAALFFQSKIDESLKYLDTSFYWAEKHNNAECQDMTLGFKYENFRDIGEYDKAFDAFQKGQELNIKREGHIDYWYENYVFAELHRRIEDYPAALDYNRKVIERMDLNKGNIWFRICTPELYALNNQFDSARYYYSLIDSTQLNAHDLRYYLMSHGEFFLLEHRYADALKDLQLALKYHTEASDLAYIRRTTLDVAKAYVALQQYDSALIYAHNGLDASLKYRAVRDARDAYELLYTVYKANGKNDSAFAYFQKYVAQKDIVTNQAMKGRFAARNYEQAIASLNKEKQLQQMEITQVSRQKQLLALAIAVLGLLCFAVVRNILLKRKNEANRRKIAEDELQLQKLESDKIKAELQQQATELEMQALRAQMNPHFIFNCLSSINRFILLNEPEAASDYLTKFSRLVRMVLNYSQKDTILLEDELEMIRLYLDLERLRFKNSFDYNIVFQNNFDAGSVYIPPLILQPFAENAIWHGLMHKEDRGHIEIAFEIENNFLNCIITDNGVGRKKAEALKSKSAEKQKSMGMQITSKRLALLNRNVEEASFKVEDTLDEAGTATGTRVTLKILYKEAAQSSTVSDPYIQH